MTQPATNYAQAAFDAVAAEMPGDVPADLIRGYALLVLTRGVWTTEVEVHDVWSLWQTATDPDHPSIVPFERLTPGVQAKDRLYLEGIHRAARTLALGAIRPRRGDEEAS